MKALSLLVLLSALNAGAAVGSATDNTTGKSAALPRTLPKAVTGDGAPAEIGDSCHSTSKICIGLKYVVYDDPSTGKPVATQADAVTNLKNLDSVWAQCDIGFQIDQYSTVNPSDYGLKFNTADASELDVIRTKFVSPASLLVVTTGAWDRSGSLGDTGANAWTNLPGSGPYGAVIEGAVATFSNIYAHELGHYLNLVHMPDETDLMDAIVYDSSTTLASDQCNTARATATTFWAKMLR